ncbi:hypothetical protein Bca52824_062383 [Brassica carinata]|uniref:Uncharacterized protein n=1 Tax=Brassica carinata TaxID=52824 RepID=A0A8X7QGY4_BRACI|nr:hypothetical protein Bca52824_062383 [Brassica carinata]
MIQEHRLKKSNAQNRATVPRKFDKDKKFTRERFGRDLSSLGLDPSSAMNRARSKSRGRKRERYDDVNDEQQSIKKLCLSRSLSRSRSVSRHRHEVILVKATKIRHRRFRLLRLETNLTERGTKLHVVEKLTELYQHLNQNTCFQVKEGKEKLKGVETK